MKFRKSLLAKYLFIICIAVFLIPFAYPLISFIAYSPIWAANEVQKEEDYPNGNELEDMWHQEAEKLSGATSRQINQRLHELKDKYADASIFWVNSGGDTQLQLPKQKAIPDHWSASYMADFMKGSRGYDADPFTIVAFIGGKSDNGFVVFQLPRRFLNDSPHNLQYVFLASFAVVLIVFIFLSWLFFNRIRKRLLHLKQAMDKRKENGIPEHVTIYKKDEIGDLEASFNRMTDELEDSRAREQEEEQLRRQLIANLSHDLRTPLTTIRGHAYALKKEDISDEAHESLDLIDHKISYLGQLIDNLLSYTLLSAGKYPYHPENVDVIRIVRSAIATWYPVFENEGVEVNVNLPENAIHWYADPQWLERILDNLLQNILRHASDGKYLGLQAKETQDGLQLVIEDKGTGLSNESDEEGVGIGLSIVSLMLKEMGLTWTIESDENGTTMTLSKRAASE
ncbi:HAMP domain-containing sensor histidine kinase [Tuberibacillus sp. Marseille-P3662]|uniref:HAMP domain-containing sensor histidine kinase n=1 Tax=Tuberibacillus sp. Marseille-P3662 TaxID=1965358 RepID=UPI000A1CBF77|nr:HAMP domain-containing sensor histidine kinase [Tuberibacillus sp. Marseille-P3662]